MTERQQHHLTGLVDNLCRCCDGENRQRPDGVAPLVPNMSSTAGPASAANPTSTGAVRIVVVRRMERKARAILSESSLRLDRIGKTTSLDSQVARWRRMLGMTNADIIRAELFRSQDPADDDVVGVLRAVAEEEVGERPQIEAKVSPSNAPVHAEPGRQLGQSREEHCSDRSRRQPSDDDDPYAEIRTECQGNAEGELKNGCPDLDSRYGCESVLTEEKGTADLRDDSEDDEWSERSDDRSRIGCPDQGGKRPREQDARHHQRHPEADCRPESSPDRRRVRSVLVDENITEPELREQREESNREHQRLR